MPLVGGNNKIFRLAKLHLKYEKFIYTEVSKLATYLREEFIYIQKTSLICFFNGKKLNSRSVVPNQGSMEEFQGVHRDSDYFEIHYTRIRRHVARNKIHTSVHNPSN